MTEEMALLREYAATRSQQAFARLVDRYVDLVYTAARRQVPGDAHLAEDVTQAVFIVLAEKARSVPADRPLSAWLLKVTGYCAANARRRRARQESHERRAAEMARAMDHSNDTALAEWNELAPMLDQGLSRLGEADRNALLLRFFEKKSLRQVGEALGISEEAAQKRVTRAIEKLRDFFRRRGATVGAGALTTFLTAESMKAAPAGLSGTVTTATTTTAAAAGGSSTAAAAAAAKGAMVAMTIHKTVVLTAAGVVLLLGIGGGTMAIRSVVGSSAKTRQVAVPLPPAAAPGRASVIFSEGSTASILGIGEVPAANGSWISTVLRGGGPASTITQPQSWWNADGSPTPAPALARNMGQVSVGSAMGRQLLFVFSLRGPAASDSGLAVRIAGVTATASTSRLAGAEHVENYACAVPANLDNTDVRLGISTGPWREDAVATLPTTTKPTTQTTGRQMFRNVREEKGRLVVDVTIPVNRGPDRDARFAVVLQNGRRVFSQEWRSDSRGATVTFPCRINEAAKLVWMTRAYEWQTVPNVALKPPVRAATTRVASGK